MFACLSCDVEVGMVDTESGVMGVGAVLLCPKCGFSCTREFHLANAPDPAQTTMGLLFTGEAHRP